MAGAETVIEPLALEHLAELDRLAAKYRRTLGFLTLDTFSEYLERNRVIGARSNNGKLVGYILFADYPDRFRIAHLCVAEAHRGRGIARRLLDALKERATSQLVIKLHCRRDFPAYGMWPNLGFVPHGEKPGRNSEGRPLTLWSLPLKNDDQLGLWKAQTSEDCLDVAIDAQIFFDFAEPDSDKALASKALQADFLFDSLNLWITDEIFAEIDRHPDPGQRKRSRDRAHGIPNLQYNPTLVEHFSEKLQAILPSRKPRERSDINHLAKVAASEIDTFTTRDHPLLDHAEEILSSIGVNVLHPVELIGRIHELSDRESYAPTKVSGMQLRWQKIGAGAFSEIPFKDLQIQNESLGSLREKVYRFLADPKHFDCELLLGENNEAQGLRIVSVNSREELKVVVIREAHAHKNELVGRYLAADTIARSAQEQKCFTRFSSDGISPFLRSQFLNLGVSTSGSDLIRFTPTGVSTKSSLRDKIAQIAPDVSSVYENLPKKEVERTCSPVVLASGQDAAFLIPIKPGFARGLIDQQLSADDLFGGDPTVLLRWENVYYRKPSHHKMLSAPGRILWYVSGSVGEIVAISWLDEVVIDTPKELFRRFKKFGILRWEEVFEISGHSVDKEIMALKFSNTFPLRERVGLSELRRILGEDGVGEVLQSPSKLPRQTFHKLVNIGFPPNP